MTAPRSNPSWYKARDGLRAACVSVTKRATQAIEKKNLARFSSSCRSGLDGFARSSRSRGCGLLSQAQARLSDPADHPGDPVPPGGSTSIIGRGIADKMSELLGEKIVVDNRPGAGGTVGTRAVAKSDPDGYTLVLGYTGTLAIGPSLYKKAGYDPRKDFAPIGMMGGAELAGGASVISRENGCRIGRVCQGQPRKGQFRLRRCGHREPHYGRIFCAVGRHLAGACSLQGQAIRQT